MARLLVVDDDDSTRMICRRFFRGAHAGWLEVEEAASGEAALERLRSGPVDCVLSDYRMGLVSGVDVLAFALEAWPQARRVLMSGFADPQLVETARERAQIHAFMEKPLFMPEFEGLLRREVLAPLETMRG